MNKKQTKNSQLHFREGKQASSAVCACQTSESLFTFFCHINKCLSFSDQAIEINFLNIEGTLQFQLSVKIWARYTE